MSVIDFAERRRQHGEAQWMLCPNCMDETSFLPVVRNNGPVAFVAGLVCFGPKCPPAGTFVELINGVPQL